MPFLQIFSEALQAGFVIPLSSEPSVHALKAFGKLSSLEVILAIVGATCGAGLSWLIGSWLAKLQCQDKLTLSQKSYSAFTNFMRKVGVWFLPLSALPLVGVLPLVAGFARVPFLLTLILVVLGRSVYCLGLFYFHWWNG